MNQNTNRDIWIGVIALIIIAGLGLWWLSMNSSSMSNMATSTAATSTMATTSTDSMGNMGSDNNSNQPMTMDRSSESVVAVAESIPDATRFASLLESSGVSSQLSGSGPYTIFVPTDGSISQLPAGTITGLSASGLKRLIEYHIISGKAINDEALTAGSIQALSGDALNFSYTSTNIPQVDSSIIVARYNASNGVVYEVNHLLMPPTSSQTPPTNQ